MEESLREDGAAGRFVLATVIPEYCRFGRTNEEQRKEGKEKAHDDAVQERVRRARRGRRQRRSSAVIEGVYPLLFESARVLLDSTRSSAGEDQKETARESLTVLVTFKVLVQIVARGVCMELQPNVCNILFRKTGCSQPVKPTQRFELCCLFHDKRLHLTIHE